MPGTATTILIDGTPTNGSDPWIDSLVSGGAWTDGDGGAVTISWTAFQGTMDGQNSLAWSPVALAGLREALSLWESVANIDFVEVASATDADAKFWWGTSDQAGGTDVLGWSELPGYSESETLDVLFNAQDTALSGDLTEGSLGFVTMVHEIGHLLGLAHPHDGGAAWDATTFPGVDWPYDDYGDYGLNQGIYTTMGYNDGWPSSYSGHTAETYGLQSGPMGLDIAAIQAIYGANANYASGDNVYTLPTANGTGTYWSSIWDTGGIDTISNEGSSGSSIIDLNASTAGSGGGGKVSYAHIGSFLSPGIAGGFTIARGVVIENAIGGSGDDTLFGNNANNRLEGGDGNDILEGGAGDDTMVGGAGDETYWVDDSGDVIVELPGGGTDLVYSSLANYTLGANLENLTLTGGSAVNRINGTGNSSNNIIHGTPWENILDGGGGADTLYGADGNDTYILHAGSTAIEWTNGGIDTVRADFSGTLGADIENMELLAGAVWAEGNELDNRLVGNDADNTLYGEASNDTLIGGIGADTMVGGSGNDVYYVDDSGDVIVELNVPAEIDTVYSSITWTLGATIENLVLIGGANVDGTGNGLANWLTGNAGFNILSGGLGNDTYVVGAGDTVVEAAGQGTDTVQSDFSYTLGANVENLLLLGSVSINGTGNELSNALTGNAGNNVLDGGAGADMFYGDTGNDIFVVDNVGDVVIEVAGKGTDTVRASITHALGANVENLTLTGTASVDGAGNTLANVIIGNGGANTLDGGGGNDILDGGAGIDTASYASYGGAVTIDLGLVGVSQVGGSKLYDIENLTGTAFGDTLIGNAGANVLAGGAGSDVVIGGAGADALSGGADADYLLIDAADTSIAGGAGFDSAFVQTGAAVTLDMGAASVEWAQGNAGADSFNAASQTGAVYIYGQGGDDTLTGSAFGDYLDGGDGTDTLAGGDGADLMLGNGGSDILLGQGGDDSLIELGGDSQIDGGAGFDSLFVWSDTGVTLNLTTASIEWVQGSVLGDDNLNAAGNTVNTFLYGWGGNDTLTAGSADDYIAGGAGDDILTGGAGNDTLIGETGFDRYVYTAAVWGSDTIHSFDFNGEKLDFTAVASIDSFADFTAYEWDPLGLGYNSTTLFYTDGGTTSAITLIGVQTASLSDADFLFA